MNLYDSRRPVQRMPHLCLLYGQREVPRQASDARSVLLMADVQVLAELALVDVHAAEADDALSDVCDRGFGVCHTPEMSPCTGSWLAALSVDSMPLPAPLVHIQMPYRHWRQSPLPRRPTRLALIALPGRRFAWPDDDETERLTKWMYASDHASSSARSRCQSSRTGGTAGTLHSGRILV